MKVYIIKENYHFSEGEEIIGVYSTLEKAKNALNDYLGDESSNYIQKSYKFYKNGHSEVFIAEYEVDV